MSSVRRHSRSRISRGGAPKAYQGVQPGASRPSRWAAWKTERGPVWRFGLKFSALMAVFYLAALTPFCDRLLFSYLEANAWMANAILHGIGQATWLEETTIRSARFAITIRRGCDAIEPSWLFCAALISFPASAGWKILGMVTGTLFLQALNLVRITSLYYLGLQYPALFKVAHLEIWPVVFILAAIGLWIGWVRRTWRPVPDATA